MFMTCSLIGEGTDTIVTTKDGKPALSGSLTSSLHKLKHANNIDGAFFVFGDISCKVVGTHRLRFSLFDLHKYVYSIMLVKKPLLTTLRDTAEVHFLAQIDSQEFRGKHRRS